MMVLGNIPVIEIGDPKIEENIEKKWKIKNNEVKSIIPNTDNILNVPVNSKYKDRFDQKIEWKKQSQVCQEFSLHKRKNKKLPGAETFLGNFKIN